MCCFTKLSRCSLIGENPLSAWLASFADVLDNIHINDNIIGLHQKLCIQKSNLHLHLTFIWFIIALVYKYELYTAFIRYPSLTDKHPFRFWQESAYLAFIYLAFIIDCRLKSVTNFWKAIFFQYLLLNCRWSISYQPQLNERIFI